MNLPLYENPHVRLQLSNFISKLLREGSNDATLLLGIERLYSRFLSFLISAKKILHQKKILHYQKMFLVFFWVQNYGLSIVPQMLL